MPAGDYLIYDVFTETALTGNPLAIVLDADGLETAVMQRIAGEFNLSETVFVGAPQNPAHTASVRIFTPRQELPFAGHPTIGTAIALSAERGLSSEEGAAILMLEENVGDVRCMVSPGNGAPYAEFDLPRLPEAIGFHASKEAVAAALGLDFTEIGFENHEISAWSAGVPYVCIPVSGLDAAAKAATSAQAWQQAAVSDGVFAGDPYIYCRDTVNHDCDFHVRMFAPNAGIPEDPATGSAAAAFAGAIMRFDEPVDGPTQIWIEQGIEMGRASRIRLEIDVKEAAMQGARIGGHAVRVAEGVLQV